MSKRAILIVVGIFTLSCGAPRPPRPAQRFYEMGMYGEQIQFHSGRGYSCEDAIRVGGSADPEVLAIATGLWLNTAYPDHDLLKVETETAAVEAPTLESHYLRATNGAEFKICFMLPVMVPR
jgi:hypothetical protein